MRILQQVSARESSLVLTHRHSLAKFCPQNPRSRRFSSITENSAEYVLEKSTGRGTKKAKTGEGVFSNYSFLGKVVRLSLNLLAIKYGKFRKRFRPELQQAALDMVEAVVERGGFSLGESKFIYCVASLTGFGSLAPHVESFDSRELEERLGKVWDGLNAVEHCVNVVKLKKFLRRLLDYRITVLLPIFRFWECF